MPWLCAAAIHISFSDEAGIDRERPPAMLASVSNTTSGLGPDRSCSAKAKCSLSLAIPTTRAKGPLGWTVFITSDKAFADASVWAPSTSTLDVPSSPSTEVSSFVRNWLLPGSCVFSKPAWIDVSEIFHP